MAVMFSWWLQNGPQDFDFLIAMDANYSVEEKNIEIWAPAFFKQNNTSVATVLSPIFLVSGASYKASFKSVVSNLFLRKKRTVSIKN